MERRCLNQLARAHRLHPVLFPVTAMTASRNATAQTCKDYVVVLYNNEFHNYEDVIRIVRRVDGCTSKQATLYAVIVNREGRTPILTNLTLDNAAAKASRVSVSIYSIFISDDVFYHLFKMTSFSSEFDREVYECY